MKSKSKKIAILIGNTEFPEAHDALPPLPNSRNDVLALQNVLTDPTVGLFTDIKPLIDLPHYEVMRNIDQVFRESERDDQVLIYYSGYSKLDNSGVLHLLTINTNLDLLHSTSLSGGFLRSILRETRCRRTSLILDCRYATAKGSRPSELDQTIRDSIKTIKAKIAKGYSFSVVAAINPMIAVNSSENQAPGLLTKQIIESIETGDADKNSDGFISIDELSNYLKHKYQYIDAQSPLCLTSGPSGDFLISRSKKDAVTDDLVEQIKNKLHAAHQHDQINTFVYDTALQILGKGANTINNDHESVFRILKAWMEDKISLDDFLDHWYRYEDTGLPEADASEYSTSIKERWKIVGKCREPIHDRVSPSYILDKSFQFLDWNPMFDELVAKPLGLMRGRHVEDFILELENKQAVIRRARDQFKPGTYPIVDIETLIFKSQYGLVHFKKIASQIFDDEGRILAWAINLNILNAENEEALWQALEARLLSEVNWSLYAKSYDKMLLTFDGYTGLVKTMTELLDGAQRVLDLAAGTGNVTTELLRDAPNREVWALEANEEMLEYMRDKLYVLGNHEITQTNIIKGDLLLSLRELPDDSFDGAVMMNALYAIEDRRRCLREINRVLKPGAVLVYSSSTQDTDINRLFAAIRKNLQDKGLLQQMCSIVDNAYDRNVAMTENIRKDSHEQLVGYAIANDFDVRESDIIRGAYEGAVTIVKATKKVYLSEIPNQALLAPKKNIKVFISYAHKDENWCQRIKDFINPLARNGQIEIWTDHEIQLGEQWREQICGGLEKSNVAILLVSTAFLNSTFITNNELPVLLHSAKCKDMLIIPVILETSMYHHVIYKYPDPVNGPEEFNLADLQSAGSPTSTMDDLGKSEQNVVLSKIAESILKLVEV